MRGALIHGVLLAVMLIYGYRTWTRDKSVKPDRGSVVLWDKSEAELAAVEYKTERKTVRLEQRSDATGSYWWGLETTIEKRPKAVEKKPEVKPADPGAGSAGSAAAGSAAAGSAGSGSAAVAAAGSGSAAGSGAGSGSAAAPPPEVVMEETKKTVEYPIGEGGEKLLEGYFKARALRDLGVPTDALKKDYKLDAAAVTTTLIVSFKDGSKREFVVGGSVFNTTGGNSDRYVMDKQSGKAFVLSKDLLGSLEIGQSNLNLTDPRGFDASKVGGVQIEAPGQKPKTVVRVTTGNEGQQVKTWGDPETKKANQTLANFVDNAANLRPTEYKAQLKIDSLALVVKLTYKDERGSKLGSLALYKGEKPAEIQEGTEYDPANPPPGETEYYIVTEKTRVPGLVRKDTAQRAEQDLKDVLSDNPPAEVKKPVGANPLGDVPLPPREKTPDPHGAAPPADSHADPHAGLGIPPTGGSAAPPPGAGSAGAGSAAPKAPGAGSAAPKAPGAGSAAAKPAAGSAAAAPKPPVSGGSAAPAVPSAPKPPVPAGSAAH